MHYLKNKHIKGVINYSLTFHMISLLCLCFFIASSFILSNLNYNFVKNFLTYLYLHRRWLQKSMQQFFFRLENKASTITFRNLLAYLYLHRWWLQKSMQQFFFRFEYLASTNIFINIKSIYIKGRIIIGWMELKKINEIKAIKEMQRIKKIKVLTK